MRFDSPAIHATAPKATRIDLFSFSTPQMRAFHVTWLAFFVCFFAWFAAAPLMPLIKAEFALTKDQIANINSVPIRSSGWRFHTAIQFFYFFGSASARRLSSRNIIPA